MIILQILYTYYAPLMNVLFQSSPIGFDSWAKILAIAFGTFLIVGFEKWLKQRLIK